MKRIILGLAALVMGASLVSCRIRPLFAPHTEHKKIDYRDVNEHRTLTLEFDDGFDFSKSGCHGIDLSCPIKGECTVCTDDVSEPVISFDIFYQGRGTKNTLEQFSMLRVTNDISEEGLLNVAIWDPVNDENLRQRSYNVGEEGSLIVFHSSVDITVTLPRDFDVFHISPSHCDITARDLSGEIWLSTDQHLTAENIAFNGSMFNCASGNEGVDISTSRCGDESTNTVIMSDGDVSYIMPEPAQMSERSDPDTILLRSNGGNVTIDMNGNTYYDINVPRENDAAGLSYTYMVGEAAMLAPEAYIDERWNDEGIIVTNGKYINVRRNNKEEQ